MRAALPAPVSWVTRAYRLLRTPTLTRRLVACRGKSELGFYGLIAEVRTWGRAISAPRLSAACQFRTRGCEAGLTGCWALQSADRLVVDRSPFGSHGLVVRWRPCAAVVRDCWPCVFVPRRSLLHLRATDCARRPIVPRLSGTAPLTTRR